MSLIDAKLAKAGVSMVAKLTCGDCRFWVGRCRRGICNKLAISEACEKFEDKGKFDL